MPLRPPPPGGLAASTVVVVLAHEPEAVARCLKALLPALGADTALAAGGSAVGRRALEDLAGGRDIVWLDADGPAAWNAAVALAPQALALVLLDEATEVAGSTLSDLAAVAAVEPDAATVTPLSNSAGLLSTPQRNVPWSLLPPDLTPVTAAARLRTGALGLHPRTPTALAHLTRVARSALDLVGAFDATLAPEDALADFCARATALGLPHVVADEVLVAHRGTPAPATVAAERHPGLAAALTEAADDRHSGLARALLAASIVLEPLQVTVDARALGPGVTGTTVHVVELLGALTAREDVRVRALLPDRLGDEAARALAAMPALERLSAGGVGDGADVRRSHVVHRPWQVESVQEMAFLDRLGERTVITNQDLIGYRTPAAFASPQAWLDYRAATRAALGLAAMVVFFSRAAAADAAADDLVEPSRARVVPLGAAPERLALDVTPAPPGGGLANAGRPFLLVLGNRFRHKNVRFALELLAALRDEQGWDGDLVIAGADVLHGSGTGDDAAWSLRHPEHAAHVLEVGAVGEPEKAWLLSHAAAVVYPSTYEGFGLIPFEAAAVGTPCLTAHVSALRDTVPPALAVLTPWDARASAQAANVVLRDPAARSALVDGLCDVARQLTWTTTGEALVAVYREAVRLPAPRAARVTDDLARAEHDYWSVRDGIPEHLWTLVRPDAPQLDEAFAHAITAVLARPDGRRRLARALWLGQKLPGPRGAH